MNIEERLKRLINKLNLRGKSDFYTRQRLMLVFIAVGVVFMVFYWTYLVADSRKAFAHEEAARLQERINTVKVLSVQLEDRLRYAKQLNKGLLSYVQELGENTGSSIVNIRLVSSSAQQEQVSFRAENLVYQEFITILRDIEQYDNVWVKSITVNKRFDNPQRIDVAWDIVRSM